MNASSTDISLERVITCSCSALLCVLTDNLFPEVFADVDGEKYYARIIKLFQPKGQINGSDPTVNGASVEHHSVGVDLRVHQEEALARHDPTSYLYTVRLIEESEQGNAEGDLPRQNDSDTEKWSGSEIEVKANALRYL